MSNNVAAPSPHLLRVSLGLIFFHFGFLKFFPDLSPAEMLASQTVMRLSGGSFDARTAMFWLALLECSIGVGFLMNAGLRFVSFLFFFHMIGTFMPLFVLRNWHSESASRHIRRPIHPEERRIRCCRLDGAAAALSTGRNAHPKDPLFHRRSGSEKTHY